MTKILMVTHGPSPDLRIDREAEALTNAGHEVFLIYRKKKGSIADYYKDSFKIELNYCQRALMPIASRIAAKKYQKIIEKINPNIIHAHDITAANIVRFVLPKKVKFVYDDHEIWEYLRKRQAEAEKNPVKKIIVKIVLFLTKKINKIVSQQADLIIVINKHWIDYYSKKGIKKSNIIAVENFANKDLYQKIKNLDININDFFKKDPRKKIVHSSKLRLSTKVVRDVSNFAKAAQQLDDWVMVVFGTPDPEYVNYGVQFIPRQERKEYLTSCLHCDVALNTLILDERFNYSSSNRFYEFIALGLRVISSKAKTYVDKFDDKLIWASGSTPVEEIKEILKNIDNYPSGKELQKFIKKYNWEAEIKKLVIKYEELIEDL